MNAACNMAVHNLASYKQLVLHELTFSVNEYKLKRIADFIEKGGTVPEREITVYTRYNSRERDELLGTLIEMGKITPSDGPQGGRLWTWIK